VTNPENVKVAIYTYDSTTLHATAILKGIGSLSGSSWNEIAVKGPCTLVLESCAFSSLKAFDNARLLVYGNSKLSGGTTLADVRSGASFYTTYNSKFNLLTPYTLTGDNAFLTVDSGATAYLDSITFSGSAVTGRRFRVRGNATVVAYNGNFTVLPGTVEGICETGGVYGGKYDYDKRMGSGGATIQETAPTFPAHGQLWWNSFNGNLYIWYIDSDGTAQWVQVNSGGA
jgi:hypothetical protein